MPTVEDVDSRVSGNLDTANNTASDALSQAQSFLNSLEQSATDIRIPYIPNIGSYLTLPSIDMPVSKPTKPNLDIANITAPTSPNLEDINIDIPNIPEANVSAPDVNIPDAPDTGNMPTTPEEPSLTPIDTPTKPDFDLPPVPTFEPMDIPAPPSFNIPEFDGEMPYNDLIPPDTQYNFSEAEYISSLLDATKSKLENDIVNGGTGLSEDVERAIFDRQKERDNEALQNAIDDTIDAWVARGLNLPDGIVVSHVDKLIRDYEHSKLDRSRDIAIKQAELAQSNTQFAITSATNLETILIQHADNVAQRALTSARAVCEVGIALFDAQVRNYNAKLDAFKTQASVFESRIRAEIAKAELYRNELEGYRIKGELQAQQVEIYKSQLAGISSLINIYKTQMEASVLQNDINRSKIEMFKSKIDAYSAQLTAKATEYELYKSKINGESLKVDLYKTRLEAYNSELNGVKTKTDILTTEARTKLENNRLLLNEYESNIRKYVAEYTEAVEKMRAYTSLYNSDAAIYDADIRYQEAKARVETAQEEIFVNHIDNNTRIAIERAKANLQAFSDIANVKVVAAKGGSDVYASMANAALTAVSTLVTLGSRALVTTEQTS